MTDDEAHRAVYGQDALRTRTVEPEKGKGRKERPRQKTDDELDFYVCQTCRALIPDPSRPWVGHYDECEVRARHVKKAGKRVLETHAELFEKLAGIEDD